MVQTIGMFYWGGPITTKNMILHKVPIITDLHQSVWRSQSFHSLLLGGLDGDFQVRYLLE